MKIQASSGALLARAAALLLCGLVLSCSTTQRLPGPLNPLPPGSVSPRLPDANSTRAIVRRQSDAVRIQRPGTPDAYDLSHANPTDEVAAGSVVLTQGPGRAELLWLGSVASVTMFGPSSLRIGDLTRGEPRVALLAVDRVRVTLAPGDRFELPGGAILRGDPEFETGPFLVSNSGVGVVQVANQSPRAATLEVGPLVHELFGGAVVDVPAGGRLGAPNPPPPTQLDRIQAGSLELAVSGEVRWTEEGGRVHLEALTPAEIHGMGLVIRLAPGESAAVGPLRE